MNDTVTVATEDSDVTTNRAAIASILMQATCGCHKEGWPRLMSMSDKENKEADLDALDRTLARLRELGGHFPVPESVVDLIWRRSSPVRTSEEFKTRTRALFGKDSFGEHLAEAREAVGLSRGAFARQMAIHVSLVELLESDLHPATQDLSFWLRAGQILNETIEGVIELLERARDMPVQRRGMTAARSAERNAGRRAQWLEVSDAEAETTLRARLDELLVELRRRTQPIP